MCYKVSTPTKDQLQGYFDKQEVKQGEIFTIEDYQHFFHADGFTRPYLPFTASESPRKVAPAQWKLLPFIVKTDKDAWAYANTLNARSEEVFTKFSFKSYIGKTRGLLWVSGFWEPCHPAPKVTVPYFVKAHNSEPFTLGCVYSNWVNQETGEITKTFSIITTPANDLLMQIHNEGQRMPLIITPENRDKWLGPLDQAGIIEMMKPLPDGYLQGYPVSNLVYKKGIDTNVPEVQLPINT
jgi:putative SOS response-associated peptidase YedK